MSEREMVKTFELIRFHLGELDEAWINNFCDNDEANMIIGTSIKSMYILLNECINENKPVAGNPSDIVKKDK